MKNYASTSDEKDLQTLTSIKNNVAFSALIALKQKIIDLLSGVSDQAKLL